MALHLRANIEALAEFLAAEAGVPFTINMAEVDPPGGMISLIGVEPYTMGLSAARVACYLIGPSRDEAIVFDILEPILDKCVEALDITGEISTVTIPVPGGGAPLPAFRFETLIELQTPEESET